MNIKEYEKIVKKNSPKENKISNAFIAFITGGIMGVIGQLITVFLNKKIGLFINDAYMYTFIILVVLSSLLTGFGFFDKIVSFAKCGLIVPCTGFAHAMTSSAMDSRKEGFVKGLGSGIFKLAGSIILYGIIFGFIASLLKGIIG